MSVYGALHLHLAMAALSIIWSFIAVAPTGAWGQPSLWLCTSCVVNASCLLWQGCLLNLAHAFPEAHFFELCCISRLYWPPQGSGSPSGQNQGGHGVDSPGHRRHPAAQQHGSGHGCADDAVWTCFLSEVCSHCMPHPGFGELAASHPPWPDTCSTIGNCSYNPGLASLYGPHNMQRPQLCYH